MSLVTHLCVSITVEAADEIPTALADAQRAVEQGADMVEWRIDLLAETECALAHAQRLVRESPAPCIITVRSAQEGGGWQGNDADRIAFLEALCTAGASAPGPAYLDFELANAERSANLRQKLELCVAHPDQVRDVGTRLILSSHDFNGRPSSLTRQWAAMTHWDSCAIAKIAWRARSVRDNIEAFELLSTRSKPSIVLCMGDAGLMSRVLAPKFGAFLTFAHAGTDADATRAAAHAAGTAPGQVSVTELIERYRFRSIGPNTRVFGVIGWPVNHSESPSFHNKKFAESHCDAVYLPIPIPPEYEHFKASVSELIDFAPLHFRGASVTLPHKEHLVRFVKERGGFVDAIAERIGAANTLCVDSDGSLSCTNTDAPAAVEALCEGMKISRAQIAGKRVAILGAGGVARAVAAGLVDAGVRVVVFNRNEARARRMCEALAAAVQRTALEGESSSQRVVCGTNAELTSSSFDAYINCTPVGMTGGPDAAGDPLPGAVRLDASVTVMDTVYAPRETPLLVRARAEGAQVIGGWTMFIKQAELQAARWRTE